MGTPWLYGHQLKVTACHFELVAVEPGSKKWGVSGGEDFKRGFKMVF